MSGKPCNCICGRPGLVWAWDSMVLRVLHRCHALTSVACSGHSTRRPQQRVPSYSQACAGSTLLFLLGSLLSSTAVDARRGSLGAPTLRFIVIVVAADPGRFCQAMICTIVCCAGGLSRSSTTLTFRYPGRYGTYIASCTLSIGACIVVLALRCLSTMRTRSRVLGLPLWVLIHKYPCPHNFVSHRGLCAPVCCQI